MTKVIAVSMVKDEMDILPYVIDHLYEHEIDGFIIADNLSTDGTFEYLFDVSESEPNFHLFPDPEVGYYQSAKMNGLVQQAVGIYGEDLIILPFDADELFYPLDDRFSLAHSLLRMGKGFTLGTVYDHVPIDSDEITGNPFIDHPYREPHIKTISSVAFSYEHGAQLAMGNHGVNHSQGEIHDVIAVRQVQYRSFEHYVRKLRNGKAAYDATEFDGGVGFHWRQGGARSDEQLRVIWDAFVNQLGLLFDPAPYKGRRECQEV